MPETSPASVPPTAVGADADRERLRELIRDLAVVRGHVILSSGAEADHYVDLRRITLHHEASPLVGRVMLDLLRREGLVPGIDAVGGLTLGADPVATAIMHASAAAAAGSTDVDSVTPALDSFVVRKANKAHGLQRRIEGPEIAGRTVVAVEDTSTTGGSVLTAVEAIREAGATVAAVAVIVDRDTGARERVEAEGLPYLSLFGLDDLGLS